MTFPVAFRTTVQRTAGWLKDLVGVEGISDQQQAAESIVDAIAQPLLMLDADLKAVSANAAYCEMFSSGLQDIEGRPIDKLDSGRWNVPELRDRLRALSGRGEAFEAVEIIQDVPSRGVRTLALAGRPIHQRKAARRSLMLLTVTDVTQIKLADETIQNQAVLTDQLSHQKVFLENLIETAQIGILLLDVDGRVVLVNPYLEEVSGYRLDEVGGKDWFTTFLPHGDREATRALFDKVITQGFNPGHVNPILTKDGRFRYIEWHAKSLTDGSGRVGGVLNTGQDVTERRKMEAEHQEAFRQLEKRFEERTRELERRRDELDRIRKLDALSLLTGGVAHDFSNLLTVVLGNLEMLRARIDDDESRHSLAQACEAAELGAQLTDRLLSFPRRRSQQADAVDLDEAISGMLDLLRRALDGGIKIDIRLASDLPRILVDEAQLRSALFNVAINARDAMPNGGTATIEASLEKVDADRARSFGDMAPKRYVALSVADTGTGMTRDTRRRAFEPFFTTKETRAGTGLGLSMVYEFARQSGGHATLDSELGQGTTVTLFLPLAEEPDEPSAIEEPSDPLKGERILVVEDDPRVRRVAVNRLKRLGYRVVEASDAAAALHVLEEGHLVDLVFTDIVMPGERTVVDLVDAARVLKPDIRILLTTGHGGHDLLDRLQRRGAVNLLRKPHDEATLAHTVRRLFDA